jgi:DNA-binding response OmpR family regulator
VPTSSECLKAFRDVQPDLVLLGYLAQDSLDCCVSLSEQSDEVPILMMTEVDDETLVEQILLAGAADYVPKPIHWAILLHRMRNLFQMKQLRIEVSEQMMKLRELQQLTTSTNSTSQNQANAERHQS